MHNQTYYSNDYTPAEYQLLEEAAQIIEKRFERHGCFDSAELAKQYLSIKLGAYTREVFAVMFLDNQNKLIEYREMFFGTINSSPVYPRDVVKAVLDTNAATIILAHNHPSGIAEPSRADKEITERLKQALSLIDVRILDHIIVGKEACSFTELGLL